MKKHIKQTKKEFEKEYEEYGRPQEWGSRYVDFDRALAFIEKRERILYKRLKKPLKMFNKDQSVTPFIRKHAKKLKKELGDDYGFAEAIRKDERERLKKDVMEILDEELVTPLDIDKIGRVPDDEWKVLSIKRLEKRIKKL